MSELSLQHIDKIYPGGVQAVYDFNIEIEHGEFIVLVGPSGCGKSTVLRMIAGLEEISGGDMYLAGARINDTAPSDRDITMVFQNYALYGHMSVYQNMGFSQIIRNEDSDVIHEKVMKAADIVQLKDQLNRYPKNLSGGQRQRVALGRSIVKLARVILMDEPLSNLDAKMRVQSRRELTKLHHDLGNTFVYVTHDQTEAMTMATRIVVMEAGRVQQIGTPEEVYLWPENITVAGFIGSPSMNFITGRVEGGRFIAPGMDLPIPQDLQDVIGTKYNANLVMGVRPEHFNAEPGPSRQPIQAEVMKKEYLGDHGLVYLEFGETTALASLRLKESRIIGSSSEYYIDMSRVHFFDPETEIRIRQDGGR